MPLIGVEPIRIISPPDFESSECSTPKIFVKNAHKPHKLYIYYHMFSNISSDLQNFEKIGLKIGKNITVLYVIFMPYHG